MKAKLNKKKVIICIIILIAILTVPVFGRYIYNSARDFYLKSRNFNFTSDLLTTSGRTYKYSNWSGTENYEIDFQLYSYENELSLFTYESYGLGYNLTCTVDDETKASVHIGSEFGESTEISYIPNITNVKDIKLYLIPTENLKDGDTVKVTVTASTTVPYEKTISATFNVKVEEYSNVTYSIEDTSNSIYATLKLINTKSEENTITLDFDPNVIRIDVTNKHYENRIKAKDQTTVIKENVTETTVNADGEEVRTVVSVDVEYVSSITFTMEPEDIATIRFYKKSAETNYTYPGVYDSLIVTVTENNEEES